MENCSMSPISPLSSSSIHDSPYFDMDIPLEAPSPSGTSPRVHPKTQVTSEPKSKLQSKNADQDWRANIAAYYTELQTLMSENPIPSHSDDTQQSLPAPFNSKEPRSETLGRTIEYIQDLLGQRKRMSNSLKEQESTIQTLREQQSTTSPSINLSTFIDAHSLLSPRTNSRPRLPLNQNSLHGLCAPAAMPSLSTAASNTKEGNEHHWEEGIAQLCMPKGAILPLAPVLPNSDRNGLASSPISANQVAGGPASFQAPSNANLTSMDTALEARMTRKDTMPASTDRNATDERRPLSGMVNVPHTIIPTLPSHLSLQLGKESSMNHVRLAEPPTPATSLHGSTAAPSLVEDSVSSKSDAVMSFTSNVPASIECTSQSHLNKGTRSATGYSMPDYFEQFSDVYSTAFPSLSSPNVPSYDQSKQSTRTTRSNKRKSSMTTTTTIEIKVNTPPGQDLGRRLSIVSTPRRGSGAGIADISSGYDGSVTEMETGKVLHLPTMPSLKNLRIHTSTIRGRRQQKKNSGNGLNANYISPSTINANMNESNLMSTVDNALGLSVGVAGQALFSSSPDQETTTANNKVKETAVTATEVSATDSTSNANIPGGADFQPSAAATKTLQLNTSIYDPSFNNYMQYMNSMMNSQTPNASTMGNSDQTQQQIYVPVSPEEDSFKLFKTSMSECTSSTSPVEIENEPRYHRLNTNAWQRMPQMTYHGNAYQYQYQNGLPLYSYGGIPVYPTSMPYYTGYPTANAPEHQHRVPSITYANLTQQNNAAHKRRFGMDAFPSYTYSYAQPPINGFNAMQPMSQMGSSNFNVENIPRYSPLLQNQQSYVQKQNTNASPSSHYAPINVPTMPMPDLNQISQEFQTISVPTSGIGEQSQIAMEETDQLPPNKKIRI